MSKHAKALAEDRKAEGMMRKIILKNLYSPRHNDRSESVREVIRLARLGLKNSTLGTGSKAKINGLWWAMMRVLERAVDRAFHEAEAEAEESGRRDDRAIAEEWGEAYDILLAGTIPFSAAR